MKVEQLRCLVEVVDQGFSMSRAAHALNISQPNVSKLIHLLEADLAVDLLLRRGGRIVGLTEPGTATLPVARRMVRDAENLRSISRDFTRGDSGQLVIATQHFIARYMLTDCVEKFHRRFPNVQIVIRQGTQRQALDMLQSSEADLGVLSRPPSGVSGVVQLPSHVKIRMSVVAACGHQLLRAPITSLAEIAAYPLIMLDPTMAGGSHLRRAFEKARLAPTTIITAGDMDVIKAYVARRLGVAILPSLCVDVRHDPDLQAVDAGHLLDPLPQFIGLHPEAFLRSYTYSFIEMVLPEWTRARVIRQMRQPDDGEPRNASPVEWGRSRQHRGDGHTPAR